MVCNAPAARFCLLDYCLWKILFMCQNSYFAERGLRETVVTAYGKFF